MARLRLSFFNSRGHVGPTSRLHKHNPPRGRARQDVREVVGIALDEASGDRLLHRAARPAFRLQLMGGRGIGGERFLAGFAHVLGVSVSLFVWVVILFLSLVRLGLLLL